MGSKEKIEEGLKYINPYDIDNLKPQRGFEYFQQLDLDGEPYSKLFLGMMYYYGMGTEKNKEIANTYFETVKLYGNVYINLYIDQFVRQVLKQE